MGFQPHRSTPDEVLAELETSLTGLDDDEAQRRLARHGANSIVGTERTRWWRILLHQFTGALVVVLLAAMVVSFAIGHWQDAIVIGIVLVLNASVGFIQEFRAENAINSLMSLVAPLATVRRGGERRRIDSALLVPGDIVFLESGDVVPADLRLCEATRLEIDEAILTGESVPSPKLAEALDGDGDLPLAEQRNIAFMGTAVTMGRAKAVVVRTGFETAIGSIAEQIRSAERAETPLQTRMARFGRRISVAIVAASSLAFVIGLVLGEDPGEIFLTAVAIAVSAVPEGLPVVMTIALAVSVRRMANRNVIVRRLPAVETLGSCTVILSDKTGTLTQNRMTVRAIWAGGENYEVTGSGLDPEGEIRHADEPAAITAGSPIYRTILVGLLCNHADLQHRAEDGWVPVGDPTEVALLRLASKGALDREALIDAHPLLDEVPFEPAQQFAATIHGDPDDPLVLVKGAPERVIEMCSDFPSAEGAHAFSADDVRQVTTGLAAHGLRVLAMATAHGPQAVQDVRAREPRGLRFAGLVGMIDPPRPESAAAVTACHQAGVRVLMVTGDHAATGLAVALSIGIAHAGDEVLMGAAIARLSDAELLTALQRSTVLARMSPADKLRIVRVLADAGEIVAVTGDGVNDAPALKAAHVGAAMGERGTDVAKEASEIVLTDDNFASVSAAIEEGRTAFSNIRKATFFLISSGVGELLAIIVSLAMRMPLPLLPAQILWLNIVTNGIEDVALAVEPGEKEEFRRPPRPPREGIISKLLFIRTLLAGVVMAAGTLVVFSIEWNGDPERLAYARVAALTTLVMFQVFHVGNCRSERSSAFRTSPFSNRFLFFGVVASALLHVGAMHFGPTQNLLRLEPLRAETWFLLIPVALTIIVAMELHKAWIYLRAAASDPSTLPLGSHG